MKQIKILLIGIIFFQLRVVSFAQVLDSIGKSVDSLTFKLVKISLKDGTKLWGVLIRENEQQISLKEFNTGVLVLDKKKIKSLETTKLETNVLLETINGASFFGKVIGIENDFLVFDSDVLGKIEIKTNSIEKITPANAYLSNKEGVWFTNPNATRYFFAPSAIPLKKREGYYQNAYLLANSVNVGLTNNITVGGGVVIPLLFYITPKVSYKVAKNFYMGAGVLFTQSFITGFDLSAGIGYGLATVGNLEHNFTLGGGYGFAQMNKVYKATPMPIVTINGMTRIGKKLSLVTENWLIPRGGYNKETETTLPDGTIDVQTNYINKNFYSYAASAGLRFMPGVKTSIDFSMVYLNIDPKNNSLILPYLDFVYKFE